MVRGEDGEGVTQEEAASFRLAAVECEILLFLRVAVARFRNPLDDVALSNFIKGFEAAVAAVAADFEGFTVFCHSS